MEIHLRTLGATAVLLPLVLLTLIACAATEDADDASSSENAATTTEDSSLAQASPDPAFDPLLLNTLQEMTTAPIMLPATLPPKLKSPPELRSAVIDSGKRGDQYNIIFLKPDRNPSRTPNVDTNQVVQQVPNAVTARTLEVGPADAPLYDFSRDGFKIIQLDDVALPNGTVADLVRLEPPEGAGSGVTFSMGMFEEEGYRYTLKIMRIDSPEGDLARQVLSTMVKVPRS